MTQSLLVVGHGGADQRMSKPHEYLYRDPTLYRGDRHCTIKAQLYGINELCLGGEMARTRFGERMELLVVAR